MIDRGELLRKLALNMARFSGLGALAARFTAGSGAILMLHRVTRDPALPSGINRHLAITPEFLDAVLCEMKTLGFRFVSMDEVPDLLTAPAGSERFIAITADDGYRDNVTCALPVLEKHGAPMTIYVAPALIEGTIDLWWDVLEEIVYRSDRLYIDTAKGRMAVDASTPVEKVRANVAIHDYLTTELPEEEQRRVIRALAAASGVDHARPSRETLMTWDEVRRASRHPLLTIGAHTLHHFNLKRLSEEQVRREMSDGVKYLEIELGQTPRHLAYPYGYETAVGAREARIAAELGFATAVTTRHGVLYPAHAGHLHALPRISINGRYQQVGHIKTMVNGVTTPLANRGRTFVTV
ncbi:polysaccharide deacetylase family protein [Mesorhizobium australicum]|uniref:Chitooligosaccharide deacetylase n=1 Tax=Mesorhizobium australicum TaxID=536018 RepID=A0A1X7P1W1_9HYPH|nr:polysaccharide deacetylase family protein [Mesorhizobium australicum]SMH44788.1 Peptidoglycan/xylan/chitin deacetylase, PgdA/CDA1 family [Mesorhizobium australicum]